MQDQLSDIQTVLNRKASEMTILQNTLLQELANIHSVYKDLSLTKKTLRGMLPQLDYFKTSFNGIVEYCLGQFRWFKQSIICLSQHLTTLNSHNLYQCDSLRLQIETLTAQLHSKDKKVLDLQIELNSLRTERRLVLKEVEQPTLVADQKSKRKQLIIKKLNQQIQKDVQRFKLDRQRTPQRSRLFK